MFIFYIFNINSDQFLNMLLMGHASDIWNFFFFWEMSVSFQRFSKNKNSRVNQTQTLPFHTILTKGYLYFHAVILLINWAVLINVVNLFCFMNFVGVRKQVWQTYCPFLMSKGWCLPPPSCCIFSFWLSEEVSIWNKLQLTQFALFLNAKWTTVQPRSNCMMLGSYIYVNIFWICPNTRENSLHCGCTVLYYAYDQSILYMWWNMSCVLHVNTEKWENHHRSLYKKPYSCNIKPRNMHWKMAGNFWRFEGRTSQITC